MGAEGTITGTINWYDDTGTLVIDDLVTGEIVNDMDYNSRYYEFDITSNNNEVTLSGYYGTYASSIDDNDFIIASYQVGNENGTWHTCPADSVTETCDIESIITLDTEVSIQDLCWTDTSLYAVIFDDPAIGEVQSLVIGCLYPRGITCEGNVIKSIYFPLNFVGPLASDGVDIWISLGQYIFRISGD